MWKFTRKEIYATVAVFFAYVATAKLGLSISAVTGFAAVIWPPTGIAIASLIIVGPKMLLAVALGAFIVNYQIGESFSVALGIASGNTIEAILGGLAISRIRDFDWSFSEIHQVIQFVGTVVFRSTIVSSIIGTGVLYEAGIMTSETLAHTFFTWWLGDALGALIVLPLIMMIKERARKLVAKSQRLEFFVLLLVTALVSVLLFINVGPWREFSESGFRKVHFLYPLIIWASLRFGSFGALMVSTLVSAFVSFGASQAVALFSSSSASGNLFAVQSFVGISTFTALLLAAATLQNRRSELKFRSIFEIAGVAMAQIDFAGKFTLVNDQFCQMTGYSHDELLRLRFRDITYPDDIGPNNEALMRLVTGKDRYLHFEKRYVRKDGSVIWVVVDSTILRNPDFVDRSEIIGVFQDITKKKIAELQAEESYRIALDASQAKSSFLAAISHEIRTPLGAIIGFTELLKDPSLPADVRGDFIETAHRNAVELGRLVDDVLDLSKVEAGRMEVSAEIFDLIDLLNDVRDTFASATKSKGLNLSMVIDDDVPKKISTDPKRLRQILVNIVGNAVKYTSSGRITIKVAPVMEKDLAQRRLGFYVEDTGCGIAENDLGKLFQPFVRLDRSVKRNIRGTGLGLNLSKRLAMLLGGDVVLVSSKVDMGSTFLVTINPGVELDVNEAADVPVVKVNGFSQSKTSQNERLDGLKILVAEDTQDQALLIRVYLTALGAKAEVAENGIDALEKALADNFDVVLMDMQMPMLSGFDATEILRKRGFSKPIIALTAQAMPEDKAHCMEAGCTSHLAKPFSQDKLAREIKKCLSTASKSLGH